REEGRREEGSSEEGCGEEDRSEKDRSEKDHSGKDAKDRARAAYRARAGIPPTHSCDRYRRLRSEGRGDRWRRQDAERTRARRDTAPLHARADGRYARDARQTLGLATSSHTDVARL